MISYWKMIGLPCHSIYICSFLQQNFLSVYQRPGALLKCSLYPSETKFLFSWIFLSKGGRLVTNKHANTYYAYYAYFAYYAYYAYYAYFAYSVSWWQYFGDKAGWREEEVRRTAWGQAARMRWRLSRELTEMRGQALRAVGDGMFQAQETASGIALRWTHAWWEEAERVEDMTSGIYHEASNTCLDLCSCGGFWSCVEF